MGILLSLLSCPFNRLFIFYYFLNVNIYIKHSYYGKTIAEQRPFYFARLARSATDALIHRKVYSRKGGAIFFFNFFCALFLRLRACVSKRSLEILACFLSCAVSILFFLKR